MTSVRVGEWRKLPIDLAELCINTTLRCGQSFRWRKSGEDEWSCALHGRIISLRQDPTHLHYRSIFPLSDPASAPEANQRKDDTLPLLRHYFNLDPNLTELYNQWSLADPNFKRKAPKFTGIRILKQDAWEALVGFICSSNNNIARISQMVEKLCTHYGPLIGHIGAQPYHDFPSPNALTSKKVEQHLRELGFGYRAKYLYQTAVIVANDRESGWLDGLRNPESPAFGLDSCPAGPMKEQGRDGYRAAHEQLLDLQGVGPKVADCVCLMGLGWGEAVPVDTHVWQIAQRDYKFGRGRHKSLTKDTYNVVGDHFRRLWGKEAGWAHSVLFTADLRTFAERLTTKVQVKEEQESNGVLTESIQTITNIAQVGVKRELENRIEGQEVVASKRLRTRRKI